MYLIQLEDEILEAEYDKRLIIFNKPISENFFLRKCVHDWDVYSFSFNVIGLFSSPAA